MGGRLEGRGLACDCGLIARRDAHRQVREFLDPPVTPAIRIRHSDGVYPALVRLLAASRDAALADALAARLRSPTAEDSDALRRALKGLAARPDSFGLTHANGGKAYAVAMAQRLLGSADSA
jgi:hypothetical protein